MAKKTNKLLKAKKLDETHALAKELYEEYKALQKSSLNEICKEDNYEKICYLHAKHLAIFKMRNACFTLSLTRRRSKKQMLNLEVAIDELDYYDLVI